MAEVFDKSAKHRLRGEDSPSFIHFGSPCDNLPEESTRAGQLKIDGLVSQDRFFRLVSIAVAQSGGLIIIFRIDGILKRKWAVEQGNSMCTTLRQQCGPTTISGVIRPLD